MQRRRVPVFLLGREDLIWAGNCSGSSPGFFEDGGDSSQFKCVGD